MTQDIKIKILQQNLKLEKDNNKRLRSRIDVGLKINLTIVLLDLYRSVINNQPLSPLYMLVDAIVEYIGNIDPSLFIPDDLKVERKMKMEYVANVLHYYYCLAHPEFLFDKPLKTLDSDPDQNVLQLLDVTLGNFSFDKTTTAKCSGLKNNIEKEFNKVLPKYSIRSWLYSPRPYKLEYQHFLMSLYENIKVLYFRANMKLDERFIITKLFVNTSHSTVILNKVFDVMRDGNLVDGDETARSRFLSMFTNTVNANDGQIEWRGTNDKNDGPSFQALRIIFEELYKFDKMYEFENEKAAIANYFYYMLDEKPRPISPEQIRRRGKKDSKTNAKLRNRIISILTSHYGQSSSELV